MPVSQSVLSPVSEVSGLVPEVSGLQLKIRRLIQSVVVAGLITSGTSASAATIFSLYGSVQFWQPELTGDVGQDGAALDFTTQFEGLEADKQSLLLAIEHPIPLIPNVQLRTTPLSLTGTSSSAFGSLGGIINFTGVEVDAAFDIDANDATFYYEVLDNWVNLDLGVTVRQLDGFVQAESSGLETDRIDISEIVPMLYTHARFQLPFSGLSVGGRGNAFVLRDNLLTDLEAYLQLEVDFVPSLDIGVQAGFRHMSLDLDDLSFLQSDATLEGSYVALTIRF